MFLSPKKCGSTDSPFKKKRKTGEFLVQCCAEHFWCNVHRSISVVTIKKKDIRALKIQKNYCGIYGIHKSADWRSIVYSRVYWRSIVYIYILSYVLSCFLKSFYVVKPVEFRIVFMFDINGRSSYGSHWHPMDNLKEPNYCWFLGRYPAW